MVHIGQKYRLLSTLLFVTATLPLNFATAQYYRFGQNRVQYQEQDWKFIQTAHFDVFFYTDGGELDQFTATAAESAYEQVSDLFRHRISKRIPILIYASPSDFGVTRIVDLPFATEAVGGLTESFKNRIALPFSGNYKEFRDVLHHEIVHAVLNDMLYGGTVQSLIRSNISIRLPGWFDEGLAEYASTGWDSESDAYIRDTVLSGSLASISELEGFDAYKGGQSVWDYIATQYGLQKIAEILAIVKATRSVETAFSEATGLSVAALSDQWERSLKEIHFPEVAARESVESVARSVTVREGQYNASPELSPRGDRVAFVASDRGTFNVYMASTSSFELPQKIASGNTSREFESIRVLSSGLSWNPIRDELAVAVSSKDSEFVVSINLQTRKHSKVKMPGVTYIRSIDWSPDGKTLAIEAIQNGTSGLFLWSSQSDSLTRLTHGPYAAHDPTWSPTGEHIVFHSIRPGRTDSALANPGSIHLAVSNLFRIDVETRRIERLTDGQTSNSRNASYGTNPNLVIFESDENGTNNLFELNLSSGRQRPLTNLLNAVRQSSMSADGSRIVFSSRSDGETKLYVINAPSSRKIELDQLTPTMWAHRRDAGSSGESFPASIAGSTVEQANPFIRDATNGVTFADSRSTIGLLASNSLSTNPLPSDSSTDPSAFPLVQLDSDSSVGGVNVGFNPTNNSSTPIGDSLPTNSQLLQDNRDEDGSYRVQDYKLRFSPDLVYGTAGYDILYGVQGVTQMRFSDMIGNHRLLLTTNLLIDLRNSDYILAYQHLDTRLLWEYSVFQVSRLLPDFQGDRPTYFRFRQAGLKAKVSYPLDKFHRIDADLSIVRGSQADITQARVPSQTRSFVYPSITFTRDITSGGLFSPVGGRRLAFGVAGSPTAIEGAQARFITAIGDARSYFTTSSGNTTLALRLSAGASTGTNPQLFYTSGVQNWINRGINQANGFPIQNATDFIFASPVLPARGFDVNERNGSKFVLANAELRFPIAKRPVLPVLKIIPIRNVLIAGFVDAGSLWGGSDETRRLDLFGENENGTRVFEDLIVGTGGGVRGLIFGYPARIDVAWPFDGHTFGRRHIYVSVGLDF